ncbi:NAD(P)-binding protein [Daldinia bambusicola]|nr:NAD(P)-binding protein [Daldinia bambusicola]
MADTHHFDADKLFGVKDYVAVVTGGGTGIGLMAAQALSANGAKVYITGRRKEVLEDSAKTHQPAKGGGQIIPIGPCDVTSKADLEKLVADLSKREKYINLLVCNAGISGAKAEPEHADADDLKARLWNNEDPSDWHDNFNTNVTAVYFTTVAFLPLLQAGIRPKGPLEPYEPSVITISSMSGIMRHAQGHFSYNTAKGATVHLTKLMSAEFQKTQIRVNSIAPGYFPSESEFLPPHRRRSKIKAMSR